MEAARYSTKSMGIITAIIIIIIIGTDAITALARRRRGEKWKLS